VRTPDLRAADRELARSQIRRLALWLWLAATLNATAGGVIGGTFHSGAVSGNSGLVLGLLGLGVGWRLQWPLGAVAVALAGVVGVATGSCATRRWREE